MANLGLIAATVPNLQILQTTANSVQRTVQAIDGRNYKYAFQTGQGAWISTSNPVVVTTGDKPNGSRYLPTWAIDYRGYFANTWQVLTPGNAVYSNTTPQFMWTQPTVGIPITGSISGKTKEKDGTNPAVVVPYRIVQLIYRPSGAVIMRTRSDATGTYTFNGLEPNVNKYTVLGFDLDASQFNAAVQDTISPL